MDLTTFLRNYVLMPLTSILPNLNLVNEIQIWYTKIHIYTTKYAFWITKSGFGIWNLDLVYQIWIWFTKFRFGRIEVKGISWYLASKIDSELWKCPMFWQTVLEDIKKSFEYVYWDVNIYWFSSASLWNSTTENTLV